MVLKTLYDKLLGSNKYSRKKNIERHVAFFEKMHITRILYYEICITSNPQILLTSRKNLQS